MNFQLYRGNLHKVPDVPRRWPLNKPSISLQVFKKVIAKRHEALIAEHRLPEEQECDDVEEDLREDEGPGHGRKRKREDAEASGMEMEAEEDLHCGSETRAKKCTEVDVVMKEDIAVDDVACEPSCALRGEDAEMAGNETELNVDADLSIDKEAERPEPPRTPTAKDEDCIKSTERTQTTELDGATPCNEGPSPSKRRAEIQEQLKQLQETKHQLVQILKQVLIGEESSKRKSQGLSQYLAPYATAGTSDLALDLKQSADLEEGELDYTRNPGPPVVVSSYGSHCFDVHPQTLGTAPGRHFNHQQLNKP